MILTTQNIYFKILKLIDNNYEYPYREIVGHNSPIFRH
jgi:hypothetical protein